MPDLARKTGASPAQPREAWPWWLRAALIAAAGLWVYWPALQGDWLWDDATLVANNPMLRSLTGLGKIWTTTPDWSLTSTLFWIEWHLWGNVPCGYHVVSFALHLAGGFLVWRLLSRLGLRLAWLGGLLFVIHPLAVESAVWISETKNTLSLSLGLLSLDAWLDHEEGKGRWSYVRSIFFYLAAMLAKTSVIMLPAVLLLYVWWKRGRVARREIVEIIPYFVLALVLGVVTIFFQHTPGNGAEAGTFFARLGGALLALLFYLGKFILPMELLPIYPPWKLDENLPLELAVPVLALVLGGWWVRRRGWGRSAAFGLGFFALNLLPVLGLVSMAYLEISPVADHFVYLPMIGLVGLAVGGLEQINFKSRARLPVIAAIAAVMLALAAASRTYAGHFVNHQSLWSYTLARNPEAWPAHNNLGDVLLAVGRLPEAQREYEAALKIDPDYAGAHSNLGTTLLEMGRGAEAVKEYREAVKLDPASARYHFNLAIGLAVTGQTADAIGEYEAALRIDPGNARAHNNLAHALLLAGRVDEAIAQCEAALRLDPSLGLAHANLGDALMSVGRYSDALAEYGEALKTEPDAAYIHYDLGNALLRLGRAADAEAAFEEALQIDPGLAEARKNLEQLRAAQKSAKP